MKKISKLIERLPKTVILATIVGLLSLTCFNMYSLRIETDSIDRIKNIIDSTSAEEKENFTNTVAHMGYKICVQSSEILAKQLETELLYNYDLETLRKEFDNSILSDKFYEVIKQGLDVKKDTNVLFSKEKLTMVATKDGIIAEFSNSDKDHIIKSDKNILKWEDYIATSHNPELTASALDIVLNNRNGIAFIQKKGDTVIKVSDINQIIDIYLEDGINALKDYYFLSASYITEDGDIFGTTDQTFLSENKNYKLIVLNTTSIQEVINVFETNLSTIDERSGNVLSHIDGYNDLRYVSSILGNIIIFLIAIMMTGIYNRKINK